MLIHDGQCGMCAYFGADRANAPKLVQIRLSHQADPETVEPCGHPENMQHRLQVSPVSACKEYKAAKVA